MRGRGCVNSKGRILWLCIKQALTPASQGSKDFASFAEWLGLSPHLPVGAPACGSVHSFYSFI